MGLILVRPGHELESSIVLQTRRGSNIENTQYWRLLPNKLAAAENEAVRCLQDAAHPVNRRQDATGLYNCHGMAFANRRTGIYEEQDLNRILADDGYREIRKSEAKPGDVILYHQSGAISHSGIVVSIDHTENMDILFILSKWGSAGEYIHNYRVCPYVGNRETFHREALNEP